LEGDDDFMTFRDVMLRKAQRFVYKEKLRQAILVKNACPQVTCVELAAFLRMWRPAKRSWSDIDSDGEDSKTDANSTSKKTRRTSAGSSSRSNSRSESDAKSSSSGCSSASSGAGKTSSKDCNGDASPKCGSQNTTERMDCSTNEDGNAVQRIQSAEGLPGYNVMETTRIAVCGRKRSRAASDSSDSDSDEELAHDTPRVKRRKMRRSIKLVPYDSSSDED
jgi:hypothetical protein